MPNKEGKMLIGGKAKAELSNSYFGSFLFSKNPFVFHQEIVKY